ncbi:MAG: cysteine desulfurase family protein [Hyphomicrobiaceae bacterium]
MTVRAYLDCNASAPLRPEARAAMVAALDLVGNPSSVHEEGRAARAAVETARERVALLAGVTPADVVFTSGGSEAITAFIRSGYDAVVVAGIEHAAVHEAAAASGAQVIGLAVDPDGLVTADALDAALEVANPPERRVLVCLQLANNETGVIQPVAELARRARAHGASVLCDAVQAAGRLPLDLDALGVDALALSAHKIGGPKGVGALVLKPGLTPRPLVAGGGQERRRRGGTENVAGIAGFGAAAGAAQVGLADMARLAGLRDRCETIARRAVPETVIVARHAPRLANTTCLAIPGRPAEMTVIRLDLAGIAVSSGAACSSGKVGSSRVLAAMGVPREVADGAIRVSFGWHSSETDLEAFSTAWATLVRPIAGRSGSEVAEMRRKRT